MSVPNQGDDENDPVWDEERFATITKSIEETIVVESNSKRIYSCDEEAQISRETRKLSLYQLVKLPIDEAARLRLKYRHYLSFARSCWRQRSGPRYMRYMRACSRRLCEIMTRRFFLHWALDPFMELTHHRLPMLCSELIMNKLKNRDLYHVCLAATGCERAMPTGSSSWSRWDYL
ncbi:unnamed protein product [Trichogramma brassicae]|uniref:Uncharacterized protein n=1 Tax=Trichogramma brassicae TaxID=86971 RepID=A0A6H5IKZ7_9HYME|nr:unnamed protein product [Trichogramma brassicae]